MPPTSTIRDFTYRQTSNQGTPGRNAIRTQEVSFNGQPILVLRRYSGSQYGGDSIYEIDTLDGQPVARKLSYVAAHQTVQRYADKVA